MMVGTVCGNMVLCPLSEAWKSPKPLNPEMLALVEKLGGMIWGRMPVLPFCPSSRQADPEERSPLFWSPAISPMPETSRWLVPGRRGHGVLRPPPATGDGRHGGAVMIARP
ncbi:hypothetical protein MASR1M66_02000 [Aminivibrio sp.]